MYEKNKIMKEKRQFAGIIMAFLLLYIIGMENSLRLPEAKAEEQSQWYEAEEGLNAAGDAAEEIVIAVIDTGVDTAHAALQDFQSFVDICCKNCTL